MSGSGYGFEYQGGTVQSGGCSYASLMNYNQGYGKGPMAPVPAGTPSMKVQIVPMYGAPGYNTLQHNASVPSCSGYFNIQSAYPSYPNSCTKYASRLCG